MPFKRQWERGDILEAARLWTRRYGRPPRAQDWHKGMKHYDPEKHTSEFPSSQPVHDIWPSWGAFLEEAGVELRCTNPYCNVVRHRARLADAECKRCAEHRRKSGGKQWLPEGVRQAEQKAILRQERIEMLQAWAKEHGRPPEFRDWFTAAPGRVTSPVITRTFGGWRRALKAAGLVE